MRAGPLSNPRVISLLNGYFVPVYATNEDYKDGGDAPPEEKNEYGRIFQEARQAGLSVGTVHVYILKPDGHPIASLHVVQASNAGKLVDLLQSTVAQLNTHEGPTLVQPAAQSRPPEASPDSLVMHLVSRGFNRGSWREFPAENWIVFHRDEWMKLWGQAEVKVGGSWIIDPDVAGNLLAYFYPQTENNDVTSNRFERQSLKATVVSNDGGVARVRLDGGLRMKHTFYPNKEDNNFVEATVVGFMDFDSANPRVIKFRMATYRAVYAGEMFSVAVRSVP